MQAIPQALGLWLEYEGEMTRTGNVVNLAQDADVAVVGGEIMWMAQPVRVNAQYNTEFRIGSILSDVKFVGGWA